MSESYFSQKVWLFNCSIALIGLIGLNRLIRLIALIALIGLIALDRFIRLIAFIGFIILDRLIRLIALIGLDVWFLAIYLKHVFSQKPPELSVEFEDAVDGFTAALIAVRWFWIHQNMFRSLCMFFFSGLRC